MEKMQFPNNRLKNLDQLSKWLQGQKTDIEIEIVSGVYYGALILHNIRNRNIKIKAQGKVTFTGAESRLLEFKRYNDRVMQAELEKGLKFERAMREGKNLILARYPNYQENLPLGGVTTFDDLQKRLCAYGEVKGYMRALQKHEWGGNSYFIEGCERDELKLRWLGDNNRGQDFKRDCVMAENIFQELDAENEFYYDGENGKLFLFDDKGFEGKAKIEILRKICLVSVCDCENSTIEIEGIKFQDTDRSMFQTMWQRYLRSDWAYNRASTVEIQRSENVAIKGCDFENLGANCIGIFDKSENILIESCRFTHSLTNGVIILGNPESTYCTSSWEKHCTSMENADKQGAAKDSYPKNITVENCYFYDLGKEDKQCAGVCVSLSRNVNIRRCTIHHLPRAGINIAENAFGGHVIDGCDVFDCVRESGDHGPFNSWGRDRFWSLKKFNTTGKYGKIKKRYALADMYDKNLIVNSRFMGEKGFGIDLDDGSCNYRIENNLCVNVGIKLREGFERIVKDNVIVNAPIDLHATFYKNDDVIENNVVYSKKPLEVIILNRGYNTCIKNNLFYNASASEKRNPLLRNNRLNRWESIDGDTFQQRYLLKSQAYGCNGAPKPTITLCEKEKHSLKIKNRQGRFCAVNETIRSLAGAENYHGVYVEQLTMFSPLKRLGVKKGDILQKADGAEVKIEALIDFKTVNEVTLFRAHQTICLKS